jgi:protein dithiol:quinone oxidoreductase
MKYAISPKRASLIGAFLSFLMIASAILIQLNFDLEPCPLCITQRIIFIVIGVLFLAFYFLPHNKIFRYLQAITIILSGVAGVIFSVRHILIQAKMIEIPAECGIDLNYMFENFPLSEAINLLFKGTGDCSQIDWTFIGLTLPQMALIGYLFFITYTIYVFFTAQ